MGFTEAIGICWSKYFQPEGRASRAEYWLFILFCALVSIALNISSRMMFGKNIAANIDLFVQVILFFPCLMVSARRLHDVNRTGWWLLLQLTIIGVLPCHYWFLKPSDAEANDYGPPPQR